MKFTLWVFNIAIENGPFIDGLPIKNVDFPYVAMLNNHMVILNIINLKKIHHWITAFFLCHRFFRRFPKSSRATPAIIQL